jgi:hypothetical protein
MSAQHSIPVMIPPRNQEVERLWTVEDLGAFMGLSPKTIISLASRNPDRLPPRVSSIPAPRWMPEVVRAWALKNSGQGKRKGGRPRG